MLSSFTVSRVEFTCAEYKTMDFFNRAQFIKANEVLEYIRAEKKLPDSYQNQNFQFATTYQYFRNNDIDFRCKINKDPSIGCNHSFLMFGREAQAFALSNKTGLLGKGGFGKVKLAQSVDGHMYAVKIQNTDTIDNKTLRRMLHVLTKLKYLVAGCIVGSKIYTIISLIKGSDLANFLLQNPLGESEALNIALKLSWAVRYVHDQNIIHGDIKENNFIISDKQEGEKITLIDFDSSIDLDNIMEGQIMTNPYSPPETKTIPPLISQASDIFQLGHVFGHLRNGWVNLSHIISKMLLEDRFSRPTIKQVIHALQEMKDNMRQRYFFEHYMLFNFNVLVWVGFSILIGPAFDFEPTFLQVAKYVLPVLSLSTLILGIIKVYDFLKNKAFINTVAVKDDPYEINSELLEQLKQKKDQFDAFKAGYSYSEGGLLDTVSTWLYKRNYSLDYYAGKRWQELNPQDSTFNKLSSTTRHTP